MNRNLGKGGLLGKIWRGGVMLSVLGLGVALISGMAGKHAEQAETLAAPGWGAEATVALAEGVARLSPIALANACGLGASSCFKCHNGKRAAAPSMDAALAPWHAQHAKTNNSCVGCHMGNPRIMKQDMAHSKLIAKPRDNAEQVCASCHKGNLDKVQSAYQATPGAK
jgi:nitrate/TMAO reductase-like tetraheme cytochrome c subunit